MVKVKPYFEIAGALHNLYEKRLLSDIGNEDVISNLILHNPEKPNDLQLYVEEKGLKRKRVCFEILNEASLSDFPVLSIDQLELLTLGKYQLSQAISYIAEHLEMKIPIMVYVIEPTILYTQFQSRHISSKHHKTFIKYEPNGTSEKSILGWTCSCQNGLRTIGCCVHVTSTLMYLSHSRYQSKIFQSANKLMELFRSGQPVINDDSDED